ncbi:hypothetical protein E3P92_02791 [Wallemia ichthyophaga]|nr:hypothetical protein E3P95_02452 [Wallemia ichthyophaga]TIA99480.1 hypothetical protein E3P94_02567 [Wallemia ichthyophaga]TIB11851.1 hypothetical protein E3P92_02791 [Wallemia ichthyophaga]TIB32660.1 hypothetical protein E3P84_02508 [Wallemia ichthyophaga]TIB38997.1 hypothetical protein E3P83_03719 [Wallemia ichthyophaga]
MQLSALNSTKSGFIIFTLSSDFFDDYKILNDEISIKLMTRALLSIMRLKSHERNLSGCNLKVVDQDVSSRLIQTISFNNGATRTHKLIYSSTTLTLPSNDPSLCTSSIIANARVLRDWLDHFTQFNINNDITLICSESSARFANASDSNYDKTVAAGKLKDQSTQTLVQVETTEFDYYAVYEDVAINFSLKEFKAILQLAEGLGAPIRLMFTNAPDPLHVVVDADDMRASMILSTSVPMSTPSQVAERSNQITPKLPTAILQNRRRSDTVNVSNFMQSSIPPQSTRKKRRINMESVTPFKSTNQSKTNIPRHEKEINDQRQQNENDQPLFLSQPLEGNINDTDITTPPPPASQIIGASIQDYDPSMARDGMNDDEMKGVLDDMNLDPSSDESSTQDEADFQDDDLLETQQNGNFKPLWD